MSYSIRVNCTCSKVLKIPEKYAGKMGRCPNCGKKISIPSLDDIKQKLVKKEPEARTCPTCGAFLNPGDHICVSCRTNLATGEWDSEGKYHEKKQPKVPYVGAAAAIAIIVTISVLLFSKSGQATTHLVDVPTAEQTQQELSAEQQFAAQFDELKNMPEENHQDLHAKLAKFKSLLGTQKTGKDLVDLYKSTRERHRELEAREAHEKLPQNIDHFTRWFLLDKLSQRYHDTVYAAKNIKAEQQEVATKIQAQVQTQRKKLQTFIEQGENPKAILEALTFLTEVAQKSEISSQIVTDLGATGSLGKQGLSKLAKEQQPEVDSDDIAQQKLIALKQDFNGFLTTYQDLQSKWKFVELHQQFQPLIERAIPLLAKFPEDEDLRKLERYYQDNQLLSIFWEKADEQAKLLPERDQRHLKLKSGQVVYAKIQEYQDGRLHVVDLNTKKKHVMMLDELAPRMIANLVFSEYEDNREMQKAAAHFYSINRQADEAKSAVERAVALGESEQALQEISGWAEEALNAQINAAKINLARIEKGKKEAQQNSDERQLERKKEAAWKLVEKLLAEYKRGHNIRILRYLRDIKEMLPRDEVEKINSKVEDTEGKSLASIAVTVYNHCEWCSNDGQLLCNKPGCVDGRITTTTQLGTETRSKSVACKKCRGTGTLDCKVCKAKRDNRDYDLIKIWYDDL